jgi:hypothetical protein
MDIEQIFAAEVFTARGKPDESARLDDGLFDLWQIADYSEAKRLEANFVYYVGDKAYVRKDIDFGENVAPFR